MRHIANAALALGVFCASALPLAAESVSELVGAGLKVVHLEVAPNGQWGWMYLGETENAPVYVCQIETPSHPNPSDQCRKLK